MGFFLRRFLPRELTLPIGFCAGVSRPNGRLARVPWFVFWKKNARRVIRNARPYYVTLTRKDYFIMLTIYDFESHGRRYNALYN